MDVNPQRVSDVLLKKTGVSADLALRLSLVFGTSPEFWMNLQAAYELSTARKSLGKKISRIKRVVNAA